MEQLTDDLLYHGDLNAALRRLLQQGLEDRNGDRIDGLREALDKLREAREDRLERYDLGGVYDDIAKELREVVDQERGAIDEMVDEARQSDDARRQELTDNVATERNMHLDMLPPDLAGQIRSLQEYDFTSSEARRAVRRARRAPPPAADAELRRSDVRARCRTSPPRRWPA